MSGIYAAAGIYVTHIIISKWSGKYNFQNEGYDNIIRIYIFNGHIKRANTTKYRIENLIFP